MEIRDATADEIQALSLAPSQGYDRWAAVAVEGGEIVGHICLSMALGQCFGHDTKYWGADKTGAARLWLRARKKARQLGYSAVAVHIEPGSNMREFWVEQGFEPTVEILRGNI